jgi:hypothetical protein
VPEVTNQEDNDDAFNPTPDSSYTA